MALSDGDAFISGSIYSYQQAERMKDNWVMSDPTNVANLSAPQPGMIASDADDDALYHYGSSPAWHEILQDGVVFAGDIHLADGAQLIWGTDSDSSIQYEEATNDAVIWGIPVAAKRGVIICDMADIAVDFTGLITATADPNMFWVDLDNDSYMAIGYAGDDLPGIYSNRALYLQYAQAQDVKLWAGIGAGNPSLEISGWDANAAALDTYAILVGMDAGAGTRFTVGLDETMRAFVICDYGDIAADLALAVSDQPMLYIRKADGTPGVGLAEDLAGFFGAAPVAQPAHIVDAPGDTTANNATTINAILVALENLGLAASA